METLKCYICAKDFKCSNSLIFHYSNYHSKLSFSYLKLTKEKEYHIIFLFHKEDLGKLWDDRLNYFLCTKFDWQNQIDKMLTGYLPEFDLKEREYIAAWILPFISEKKKWKVTKNDKYISPQCFSYFCPITGNKINPDESYKPPKMKLSKLMWT